MYIYNVTLNVDETIHSEWLKWMKEEHIPAMMDTGKFKKAMISRVMVEEPMGGVTYAIQYTTKNKATLNRYYEENAAEMRKESKQFGTQVSAFRTEMEIIDEQ